MHRMVKAGARYLPAHHVCAGKHHSQVGDAPIEGAVSIRTLLYGSSRLGCRYDTCLSEY